ncbi:hypothetical protein BgAZ_200070 [Babesia gibsoni]|uniref:EGF-like domain-containing protein n=1 Tax=Babesia gibsoni TaxID=33632 RepID=A0AAD8PE31_BABGI|nr:hypothetical protein BgAZ_200070 [Babesia gibsoni]
MAVRRVGIIKPETRRFTIDISILLLGYFVCRFSSAVADDTSPDKVHACKNGATCVELVDTHKPKKLCICTPGFTGWDCSEPVDYCNKHCRSFSRSVPCNQALCNHGLCNNKTEYPYYACDCGPFYSGKNCEIEYNPCSQANTNPCENGTCTFIKGTNQVMCKCHSGWTTLQNQQFIKLNWNGTEIFVSPPCSEKIQRGITGAAPLLSPSEFSR